jgi:hypothetical protein
MCTFAPEYEITKYMKVLYVVQMYVAIGICKGQLDSLLALRRAIQHDYLQLF